MSPIYAVVPDVAKPCSYLTGADVAVIFLTCPVPAPFVILISKPSYNPAFNPANLTDVDDGLDITLPFVPENFEYLNDENTVGVTNGDANFM